MKMESSMTDTKIVAVLRNRLPTFGGVDLEAANVIERLTKERDEAIEALRNVAQCVRFAPCGWDKKRDKGLGSTSFWCLNL